MMSMQMYIDFIDGSVKLMAGQLPAFILILIIADRLIHNYGHTIISMQKQSVQKYQTYFGRR